MNIQRKNSAHHFRMQSEREQTLVQLFLICINCVRLPIPIRIEKVHLGPCHYVIVIGVKVHTTLTST